MSNLSSNNPDLKLCYPSGNSTSLAFSTGPTGALKGFTLGSGVTYYIPFGTFQSPIPVEASGIALAFRWAAAVAGTVTLEASCFPATLGPDITGGGDVNDWDASTDGSWQQWNAALVEAMYTQASGASNSVTAFTWTMGGAAAGGGMLNIPDISLRRLRLKVVTTVGGLFRACMHGKGD